MSRRMNKDDWADLWATVKALRTVDLTALRNRICDELTARQKQEEKKAAEKAALGTI